MFLYHCKSCARAFPMIWFILVKCQIKKKRNYFSDPSISSRIEISFPARFTLIRWHDNKTLMGEINGWISGIRPTGVLIIHVSAREHVAGARHSTGHAANICLISPIKGRSVYSSHFRRADLGLLCNIQRGVRRRNPGWSYRHRFSWTSRRIYASYFSIGGSIDLR